MTSVASFYSSSSSSSSSISEPRQHLPAKPPYKVCMFMPIDLHVLCEVNAECGGCSTEWLLCEAMAQRAGKSWGWHDTDYAL
jgi:hypothetical protein